MNPSMKASIFEFQTPKKVFKNAHLKFSLFHERGKILAPGDDQVL